MREGISRRKLLGSVAALGGTGIAYKTIGTTTAETAEISFGEYVVPNVSHLGTEIEAITLTVDAEYHYTSSHVPDKYVIELLVGDSDTTLEAIDSVEQTENLQKEQSGVHELSGKVTSTYHFTNNSFVPSNGGKQETTVYTALSFRVVKGEETIAESEIVEPVVIAVDGTELDATAELKGTGEILIS